jgi:hypothetical protein
MATKGGGIKAGRDSVRLRLRGRYACVRSVVEVCGLK